MQSKDARSLIRLIAGLRRYGLLPLLLSILYSLIYFADRRVVTNSIVNLHIHCIDNQYELAINGRTHQVAPAATPAGLQLGFYVWHRGELEAKETFFRNLKVRSLDKASPPLQISLTEKQQLSRFRQPPCTTLSGLVSRDARWEITGREGTQSRSETPGASIILLREFEASNFVMSVDIVYPFDAGIIFHADGLGDGEIFAVRPPYNDALLFSMSGGTANPIQHLFEYSPLRPATEMLRLASMICRILFWAGMLWLINRLLLDYFKQRSRSFQLPQFPIPAPHVKLLLALLVFVCALAVFAFIAYAGFNRIPHITDEAAYLFQARIFAAGKLWAPPPPISGFFDHYHLMVDGHRWFSKYPPLFSVILAAGVLCGIPWMINPLLGAMLAVTVYLIAQRFFSLKTALVTCVLFILSPLHMFMSATMMAHTLTALCLWQMIYHSLVGARTGSPGRFAAAGAFWAAAFMTRPFTAAVVLLPVFIGLTVHLYHLHSRKAACRILGAALAGAYPLLVIFACWSLLYCSESGRPMIPYVSYHSSDSLGFGAEKGADWLMTWGSWGHTPAKALRSICIFLGNTMHYLQGWPHRLSLFFIPLAFLNENRGKHLMALFLGVFLSLVAGHAFYWATEHLVYGARYWYSGMPGLSILSAAGLVSLFDQSKESDKNNGYRFSSLFPLLAAAVFMGWNLTVYLPPKFFEAHTYGGISSRLGDQVAAAGMTNTIIFVKTENSLYNDGFHLNDPFLRKGPYFVNDLGPRNDELMKLYPDYRAFRWDKTSLVPVHSAPAAP